MNSDDRIGRRPFQTQAGLVYERLWEMISSGDVQTGESVSLRTMAARLGTSIGPVRDALALLSERGLVEKVPKFGYRVRGLTRGDIVGYFTVRRALLAESARLAAGRISDGQLEELYALADEADALIKVGDYAAADAPDDALHQRLAIIGGCRRLAEEINRITAVHVFLPAPPPGPGWRSHRQLVDAIATRDPMGADEEMRAHVDWAFENTLETFDATRTAEALSAQSPGAER